MFLTATEALRATQISNMTIGWRDRIERYPVVCQAIRILAAKRQSAREAEAEWFSLTGKASDELSRKTSELEKKFWNLDRWLCQRYSRQYLIKKTA